MVALIKGQGVNNRGEGSSSGINKYDMFGAHHNQGRKMTAVNSHLQTVSDMFHDVKMIAQRRSDMELQQFLQVGLVKHFLEKVMMKLNLLILLFVFRFRKEGYLFSFSIFQFCLRV